jgi:hypothetical protein
MEEFYHKKVEKKTFPLHKNNGIHGLLLNAPIEACVTPMHGAVARSLHVSRNQIARCRHLTNLGSIQDLVIGRLWYNGFDRVICSNKVRGRTPPVAHFRSSL